MIQINYNTNHLKSNCLTYNDFPEDGTTPLTDKATPPAAESVADLMKSIRQITRALDMRSKRVARETGLTIPQIVVLHAVRHFGQLTTAAISRQADLSPATTVIILDKLEARGLVERRRSTSDRRIVHTALTDHGAQILSEAPALLHRHFLDGFAQLPESERRAIVHAFRAVVSLLEPRPS